jgi:TatD DNase family protein
VKHSEWELSKNIYDKYPQVEFSIGVHPWYVSEVDRDIKLKLDRASSMGAVAIGEIGLDMKIGSPEFELQKEIFELQLQYAVDTDMPIIVHCRGAFNELIEIFNRIGVPRRGGIIHAYSGSLEITEILIKKGLSFSMGGTLTYRNSRKRSEVLKRIYPDYFLLETDSPDIPPVNTEKPNVPSNILLNLRAASEILSISEDKIAESTTANAIKIFGLKP